MFDKFKEMVGGNSWATSVIGFLAGVTAYLHALGPNLPVTASDWGATLFAAALVALGYKAK